MEAATGSQGPFSGHLPTLLAMRPSGMPPAFSCRPALWGACQHRGPPQHSVGSREGQGLGSAPREPSLPSCLVFPPGSCRLDKMPFLHLSQTLTSKCLSHLLAVRSHLNAWHLIPRAKVSPCTHAGYTSPFKNNFIIITRKSAWVFSSCHLSL